MRATGGSPERLGVGAAVTQEQKEVREGVSQRKGERSQSERGPWTLSGELDLTSPRVLYDPESVPAFPQFPHLRKGFVLL